MRDIGQRLLMELMDSPKRVVGSQVSIWPTSSGKSGLHWLWPWVLALERMWVERWRSSIVKSRLYDGDFPAL